MLWIPWVAKFCSFKWIFKCYNSGRDVSLQFKFAFYLILLCYCFSHAIYLLLPSTILLSVTQSHPTRPTGATIVRTVCCCSCCFGCTISWGRSGQPRQGPYSDVQEVGCRQLPPLDPRVFLSSEMTPPFSSRPLSYDAEDRLDKTVNLPKWLTASCLLCAVVTGSWYAHVNMSPLPPPIPPPLWWWFWNPCNSCSKYGWFLFPTCFRLGVSFTAGNVGILFCELWEEQIYPVVVEGILKTHQFHFC